MKVITLNKNNYLKVVGQAVKELTAGGLVIFPSDTVYGLLVDATNKQAVEKLIAFKNRPAGKPISVFTSLKLINRLVKINKGQAKVIEEILPGPFTLILPSAHKVVGLLESETGSLGVRVPDNRNIERLVERFQKPITATSANLAGRFPHHSIQSLLNDLSDKQKTLIDLIVDAGQLPRNKPSTVVDLSLPEVKILRQGEINFKKSKILLSKSVKETKAIAKKIYEENLNKKNKPLIFIIEGELGVGKTIFAKGIGETMGIKNIISPTFVIYYEYGNFYHFDLYQIEDKEEFRHLGIEKMLKPGNILCFEWGEKAGEIISLLRSKGNIVYIKMEYIDEQKRKIIVND